MKVSVIGAGGFVGREVTRLLAREHRVGRLSLLDAAPFSPPAGVEAECLIGDLGDPAVRRAAIAGADKVIVLASVLGGAAEANYALARRVNVDATLDLLEDLRDQNPATRVVFASTIAGYSKPMPDPVTDSTPLGPLMIYGAQKLMIEVALSNFAARGWLDGVSLRPSGVMARDDATTGLRTAFMSRLFWAVARGEDIELPVAPESRTWLSSVGTVARNFVHGAMLPEIGPVRAFTLPARVQSFGNLVEALRSRFPGSASQVRFKPDPEIVALFGSYPDLVTETADRLGFSNDDDAASLIENSMFWRTQDETGNHS